MRSIAPLPMYRDFAAALQICRLTQAHAFTDGNKYADRWPARWSIAPTSRWVVGGVLVCRAPIMKGGRRTKRRASPNAAAAHDFVLEVLGPLKGPVTEEWRQRQESENGLSKLLISPQ